MIQRLWRTFRLFFMIVLFLALGVYLFLTTPWGKRFGRGPDYGSMMKEGEPIAWAIQRYRVRTNLWPEYLEDLAPAYLAQPPSPVWYYTLTAGGPSLARRTSEAHQYLGCDVAAEPPQWRVFGDGEVEDLPSPRAGTAEPPPPVAERLANEIAELRRRIAREPRLIEHRRDLISLLQSEGRVEAAREQVKLAAADFPEDFWPVMAMAALDRDPAAFARWAEQHPSFTHFYYVSVLEGEKQDPGAVKEAIRAALRQPAAVGPDDPNILAFYFFDMSRTALALGDPALALDVTSAWAAAAEKHLAEEKSYLPLRAAAELALGKQGAAQADLQTFDSSKSQVWAQHLDALRQAVQKGDRAFRYDPGEMPPPYAVFQLPQ